MQNSNIAPTGSFSMSRDLDVAFEEPLIDSTTESFHNTNNSYLDNMLNIPYNNSSSYLENNKPLRRARAGTMPSTIYHINPTTTTSTPPPPPPSSMMPPLLNSNNRNRSGSLTLPNDYYAAWETNADIQGDDIARTLRSIGLVDDKDEEESGGSSLSSNSTTNLATPPTTATTPNHLLLPRQSIRSRSYSVNNAPFYQQQQQPFMTGFGELESFHLNQSSNNRPRASSMGRMDFLTPPGLSSTSSLWKMQLGTVHDVESAAASIIEPLSLGDSELLANMLHPDSVENRTGLNIPTTTSTSTSTIAAPAITAPAPATITKSASKSRSLWIGNIDTSINVDNLNALFSMYGPIESIRLLMEKECAFINFCQVEDAIYAKEDVLTNLGGKIGNCIVRIGYGRATEPAVVPTTMMVEQPVVSQPTRALWLGNMPVGTTQAVLQRTFSFFGVIESVRVLSHKNCAFINYETVESAMAAHDALVQNDVSVQESWGVRVGFAKVPPAGITKNDEAMLNKELWSIMKQLLDHKEDSNALELVQSLQSSISSSYFESIPPVPEYGQEKRHDASKLKEIRKKLDLATATVKEADDIALDCLDEIAEICSDYIGNTVIQRLFEKCSEETKTIMLRAVAPHLAALGVHKNGTWAAQKIIDSLTTKEQIETVCVHIQPFIPPLLLDQFGNYVVQCCLRHENNQYIVNAMVEKFLHIAQGRFGSRAMRGILEGNLIDASQRIFITAALLQNSTSLSIHANGALLISWLIEASQISKERLLILASQLAPNLVQVATHKLGSQILCKLINQAMDIRARQCLLEELGKPVVMEKVLSDQSRGFNFATKVMASEDLSVEEKSHLNEIAHPILMQLKGIGFKKALLEFAGDNNNNNKEVN